MARTLITSRVHQTADVLRPRIPSLHMDPLASLGHIMSSSNEHAGSRWMINQDTKSDNKKAQCTDTLDSIDSGGHNQEDEGR